MHTERCTSTHTGYYKGKEGNSCYVYLGSTSHMCGDSYMHAGTIAEATHLALWVEQGVGQEH